MSLTVVTTTQLGLVTEALIGVVKAGYTERRAATVIVGHRSQIMPVRKALVERALITGISVYTPALWIAKYWRIYGTSQRLITAYERRILMKEVFDVACTSGEVALHVGDGVLELLCRLSRDYLAWLPREDTGDVLRVLAQYRARCEEHAILEPCCALYELFSNGDFIEETRAAYAGGGPAFAGCISMRYFERFLVRSMARIADTTLCISLTKTPADAQVNSMVDQLTREADRDGVVSRRCPNKESCFKYGDTADELMALRARLFVTDDDRRDARAAKDDDRRGAHAAKDDDRRNAHAAEDDDQTMRNRPKAVTSSGAVTLATAAGPTAVSELVAREIDQFCLSGASRIVVVTPTIKTLWHDLSPKLAARGISCRAMLSHPLSSLRTGQACIDFLTSLARLIELDAAWPPPEETPYGPVPVLGDMSWWPPRMLTDFLTSDLADIGAQRAWALDVSWRSMRVLTPADVINSLTKGSKTSERVAIVVNELVAGHVMSACHRLLEGVSADAESVWSCVQTIIRTFHSFGITVETRGIATFITMLAHELQRSRISRYEQVDPPEPRGDESSAAHVKSPDLAGELPVSRERPAVVELIPPSAAQQLEPSSVDALIYCGLTTVESSLSHGDDPLSALLAEYGLEQEPDSLAKARAEFFSAVCAPTKHLVLVRTLYDADAKPTYQAVMLGELMAAYEDNGKALLDASPCRGEDRISENLSADGRQPQKLGTEKARSTDEMSEEARKHIVITHDRGAPDKGGKGTSGGAFYGLASAAPNKDDKGTSGGASYGLASAAPDKGGKGTSGGASHGLTSPESSSRLPRLSASQIETYLECPYKWFTLRRLGIGDISTGISGMEMGAYAHHILEVVHVQLLYEALRHTTDKELTDKEISELVLENPRLRIAGSRVTDSTLAQALALLDEISAKHRVQQRQPSRNRAHQVLVAHVPSEQALLDDLDRSLQSTLTYEAGVLAGFEPRFFEFRFGGEHAGRVNYAGADLLGSIDRIDVDRSGRAVIIDYKYKTPTALAKEYALWNTRSPNAFTLPRRVQTLIYASAIRRVLPDLDVVGALYMATKPPHALVGALDEGIVDRVCPRMTDHMKETMCAQACSDITTFNELLDRVEESVAEAVARMVAGDISVCPADAETCRWCPVITCTRRRS